MKFYQHWIGDYQGATKRLSMLEHGAYRLLMDEYYSSEEPLPLDLMQLHRICMAFASEEQEAVHKILRQFFKMTEDGWTHERIDKEIGKARKVSESMRENARRRWAKDAVASAKASADEMQKGCLPQPQPQSKKKPICSEGKSSEPPVIELILNTKEMHPITQEDIDDWIELFPSVDVLGTLRKMAAWCKANPQKRKTDRGIRRFVVQWLSKEQDKGHKVPTVVQEKPLTGCEDPDLDEAYRRAVYEKG